MRLAQQAAGTVREDRQLIARRFVATVGEEGRPLRQTCSVRGAVAGGGHLVRRGFRAIEQRNAALPVPSGQPNC